jgi:uncharacterized membrane protein YccC
VKVLVRSAVRVDPSGVEIGFGVRCTAGVALALLGSFLANAPVYGVAAAMGALAAGFASRQGVYRTRAATMLITSAAMGASAFVGAFAERSPVGEILLVALWGVGFGLIGSLGTSALPVGLNAVIAVLVFGRPPFGASVAVPIGLFVFLGGVLQTLLLVLIWPLQRFTRERRALAAALRDLAGYARDLPASKLGSPAPKSLATVAATLADAQPFGRRSELAAFQALLDSAERLRGMLAALATDRVVLAAHDASCADAIQRLTASAAEVVSEIAAALEEGRAPEPLEAVWHEADQHLLSLQRGLAGTPDAGTTADGRAFLAELRTAWRIAGVPADRTDASPLQPKAVGPFALSSLGDALETLRANLSPHSVWAQHALRLGVTMLVGEVLANLVPLQRAYWIPLTAVILLRPDFTTTFSRGLARAGGTVLGAIVASVITALVGPSPVLAAVLAVGFAWVGYTLFNVNYAIFSLAITCYVVFLLASAGAPEHLSAVDRVAATLIGGALAFAVYGIWPTWSHAQIATVFADLLDAQRRYAIAVLRAYREPARFDAAAIRGSQLEAWRARSSAEAAVDQMLAEPVTPRHVSARAALAFLAASRRFGAAALALHARLSRVKPHLPVDFETLTDELGEALDGLAAALRSHSTPPLLPPLRDRQVALKTALDTAPDPDLAALVAETDLLVEALAAMTEALQR